MSCRLRVKARALHGVQSAAVCLDKPYTVEVTEKTLHRLLFHYARKGSTLLVPGELLANGKTVRAKVVHPV